MHELLERLDSLLELSDSSQVEIWSSPRAISGMANLATNKDYRQVMAEVEKRLAAKLRSHDVKVERSDHLGSKVSTSKISVIFNLDDVGEESLATITGVMRNEVGKHWIPLALRKFEKSEGRFVRGVSVNWVGLGKDVSRRKGAASMYLTLQYPTNHGE